MKFRLEPYTSFFHKHIKAYEQRISNEYTNLMDEILYLIQDLKPGLEGQFSMGQGAFASPVVLNFRFTYSDIMNMEYFEFRTVFARVNKWINRVKEEKESADYRRIGDTYFKD